MPGRAEKIFCHKNYKGCKRQSCRLQPFLIIYKIRILRLQIYLIRILQLQSLTWISWIISSITRSPVIVIILWLFSTRLHDAAGMLHLDYQNRWYQILLLLHEFFHHFIIRKTKCFRILERNAKISKTKRNFSRLYPTPQKFKKIDRLRRNEIHLKAVRTSS